MHVGSEVDNRLKAEDLRAAALAGCVRLTTGLESGSQRVIDLMKKGTRLNTVASMLQDAASANISMRCTMVLGYPGETAEDVQASADFLEQQNRCIERVSLNRLGITTGTTLHRTLRDKPSRFKGLQVVAEQPSQASVTHRNDVTHTREYRKATARLLTQVHRINQRPLSARARDFEGVM